MLTARPNGQAPAKGTRSHVPWPGPHLSAMYVQEGVSHQEVEGGGEGELGGAGHQQEV